MYKLNVPFSEKEVVKQLGAKWNGDGKFWFVSNEIYNANPSAFDRWISNEEKNRPKENIIDKIYEKLFDNTSLPIPIPGTKNYSMEQNYRNILSDKEYFIWNKICNTPYSENPFSEVMNSELVSEKTVFLDTETTGINAPEVIELGIVDAYGKEIFHSFFKPSKVIEEGASAVNNITNKMLEYAPTFNQEWMRIQEILMSADKIYAYNSAFDVRAIENTLTQQQINMDIWMSCKEKFVDAQPIAVKYAKENFSLSGNKMKLQKFADYLELNFTEKHSASSDAYLILLCFNNMKPKKKENSAEYKQNYKFFIDIEDAQKFVASIINDGSRFVNIIQGTNIMIIYEEKVV